MAKFIEYNRIQGKKVSPISLKNAKKGDIIQERGRGNAPKFIVIGKPFQSGEGKLRLWGANVYPYYPGYRKSHLSRAFFPKSDKAVIKEAEYMRDLTEDLHSRVHARIVKSRAKINRSINIRWSYTGHGPESNHVTLWASFGADAKLLFNGLITTVGGAVSKPSFVKHIVKMAMEE